MSGNGCGIWTMSWSGFITLAFFFSYRGGKGLAVGTQLLLLSYIRTSLGACMTSMSKGEGVHESLYRNERDARFHF